jgi:hypothetical protein
VQLGNYRAPRPFPGGEPAAACQHAAGSPSAPPGVRASARGALSTGRGPIRWCSRESKRTGTSRRSRPRRSRGHRGDRPCAVGTFAWYMNHRSRTGGFGGNRIGVTCAVRPDRYASSTARRHRDRRRGSMAAVVQVDPNDVRAAASRRQMIGADLGAGGAPPVSLARPGPARPRQSIHDFLGQPV